jgi:hypothetical protein
MNKRHAKWIEIIEISPYIIKHNKGKEYVIANLTTISSSLLPINTIKLRIMSMLDVTHKFMSATKT